jgi:hypothetical protein
MPNLHCAQWNMSPASEAIMHRRTVISVVLALVASVLISMLVYAAMIQLPRTGQVLTFIPHDDGALKQGAPSPAPRFVDNGDGTVTDSQTGLIWLQNANCTEPVAGVGFASGRLIWADALTWNNSLSSGACGLSDGSHPGDWRVPNVNELESLVDVSQVPTLPANNSFTSVQADGYWTSTTAPGGQSNSARYINLNDGTVNPDTKTSSKYVWAVRGGQAGASTASLSPTVKDFGSVHVNGAASPQLFTMINSGSANLVVSSIGVTGSDAGMFTLNVGDGMNGSCGGTPTLAPGGSCTLLANFAPTTAGAKAASLRVVSNDAATPNKDLALSGTGALPISGTGTVRSVMFVETGLKFFIFPDSGGRWDPINWDPQFKVEGMRVNFQLIAVKGILYPGGEGGPAAQLLSITALNHAPVISGIPPTPAYVGLNYSFTPSASDLDNDTLAFSIQNKPSWAYFNTSTGALTGVPTSGVYNNIIISVTDGNGGISSLPAFVITPTLPPGSLPFIFGTPPTTGTIGTYYSFTPTWINATSFTITNMPEWASFSTVNGSLTGMPRAGNYNNIVISAINPNGSASLAPFTISISTNPPGPIAVPVMDGVWLLPGLLAGIGLFARRRK